MAEDSGLVGCRHIFIPASWTFGRIVSPSSSRHLHMTQRNISEDRNIQVPFRILSSPQGSPEIDGTVTLRLQQCRVLLQEPDIGSAGGSNRSSHYGCLGAGGGSGSSHHSQ